MASDIISHDHMIQIGREYVWACNPLVFVLPALTEEAHTHTHTHTLLPHHQSTGTLHCFWLSASGNLWSLGRNVYTTKLKHCIVLKY